MHDNGYILAATPLYHGDTFYNYPKLIRLNSNGTKLWDRTYGNESYTFSLNAGHGVIEQTSDGGYIMACCLLNGQNFDVVLIKVDLNGSIVWEKFLSHGQPIVIRNTTDGGYIVFGQDLSVIKTNSNGDELLHIPLNMAGILKDAQETRDGGFILVGYTSNSLDPYALMVKIDANGIIIWDKLFGSADYIKDNFHAVQTTSDGGYILAGSTQSYGAGFWDAWLVKTDADGNAPATPTP